MRSGKPKRLLLEQLSDLSGNNPIIRIACDQAVFKHSVPSDVFGSCSADPMDAFFFLAFTEMDAAYDRAGEIEDGAEREQTRAIISDVIDSILDAWEEQRRIKGS